MKKRKWWLIPAGFIVLLLILTVIFWQTLVLYIAPKTVLTAALTDTVASLESRFSSSPLPILLRGMDSEGKNTVDLHVDTANDLLGEIQYDMHVQMEQNPRRIMAIGQVGFGNTEMDLSVYLDGNFAALSSSSLLQGNFYGLTYDTFSQDIRSNKLLSVLIGEKTLNEWESKINTIHTIMSDSTEVPDVSQVDLKPIALGLLALDADVERVRIDLNGAAETYYVISFETTGADIASGLAYLKMESPDVLKTIDDVEISFWLRDQKIGKIEIEAGDRKLDIYCGIAPVSFISSDDLYVQYHDAGDVRTVHMKTREVDGSYQETITLSGWDISRIAYQWNPASGDWELSVDRNGETHHVFLNLSAEENGFRLQTADFEALMHMLAGTKDSGDSPCTMHVTKGAKIETPVYKNFDQWSMEDMLTLLSGIGGLLGLKIA